MAKQIPSIKRPYTTDYGITKGHCKTAEGAKIAAVTYCIRNAQRFCTIEGPGGAKARIYYNGHWGLQIVPAGAKEYSMRIKGPRLVRSA